MAIPAAMTSHPRLITSDATACVISPFLRTLKELDLELESDTSLSELSKAVLVARAVEFKEKHKGKWADDVNKKDDQGRTALRYAVETQQLDVATALLVAKADPNIQDVKGRTPLHVAARIGDMAMCDVLIKNGAKEMVDSTLCSPLHMACVGMNWQVTMSLISMGMSCTAKEATRDTTPLHLVVARIANTNGGAVIGGGALVIEKLLECGASPNAQDVYGNTPLHIAANRSLLDVCNMLLSKKADPNAKNKAGNTPLHVAAMRSASVGTARSPVQILLDNGGDAMMENAKGKKPRDLVMDLLNATDQMWSPTQTLQMNIAMRKLGGSGGGGGNATNISGGSGDAVT